MMGYGFAEIVNRIIKYLIEGLVIAAAAIFIPKKALPMEEVMTLAVLAAVGFAILDAVSPSVGVTARQGLVNKSGRRGTTGLKINGRPSGKPGKARSYQPVESAA
jgi:hypothetical protein